MDIRRKDIYKGVDGYIKYLRKKEAKSQDRFSILKKKKERIEPKPELSETEIKEEVKELIPGEMEKEAELQEEVEKEEEKISFLSFMSNLFKKKEEEKLEEEDFTKIELYKPKIEEDTKKALKIADELLKKVPSFELRKFMQSKDYEVYESIMKKYGLR